MLREVNRCIFARSSTLQCESRITWCAKSRRGLTSQAWTWALLAIVQWIWVVTRGAWC